jgi:hypothetical protein
MQNVKPKSGKCNKTALFKLAMLAKKEIADGKGMTPEGVLGRLRAARKKYYPIT